MTALVHQSTLLVSRLKVGFEQVLLVDRVHADALIFDRNLDVKLVSATLYSLHSDEDHAALVRKLDRI